MAALTTKWIGLVLVFGIALIVTAAWWETTVHGNANDALLQAIENTKPMTYAESQQIRHFVDSWRTHLAKESFKTVIVRDFGIAFTLAVILTIILEANARQRLQDQITTGVVEAVFKRLIPASIFEEVRAYVIGARVVKREWALNMNLQYDPSLKLNEPDHFISRTTVSYKLFNIMPYAEVQVIRSSLNLDLSGADATGALPRYDKVSLDNEKFEGETLTHLLGEDRCSYQIMRSIEGNQRKFVHVVNEISEIVRIPDTFVWSMNAPTEDATINITSSDPNVGFQVRALHPDSARLT